MKTKKLKAYEVPIPGVDGKPSGKTVYHMSDEDGVFLVCPYKPAQLPCGSWCMHFNLDRENMSDRASAYCKDFELGEVIATVKYMEKATTPDGKQGKIVRPN